MAKEYHYKVTATMVKRTYDEHGAVTSQTRNVKADLVKATSEQQAEDLAYQKMTYQDECSSETIETIHSIIRQGTSPAPSFYQESGENRTRRRGTGAVFLMWAVPTYPNLRNALLTHSDGPSSRLGFNGNK